LDLAHELLAGQREEIAELGDEVERLRSENAHKGKANLRLADENARLTAALDTIERRLSEGYAPGMPWSNEEMALEIVREEKRKALRGSERSHKAILALTAEVERLRAAIVEWGRAESLPDCSACAVFDAALTGSE
jgi:hypothetical protein